MGDAPEGLAISPKGDLAAALNVDGSNLKQAWFYHPNGSVTILRIQGKTVTPVTTVEVGAFPEPMAFSPDGQLPVRWQLRRSGFLHPEGGRRQRHQHRQAVQVGRPSGLDADGTLTCCQFPTDCTLEKSTDSAPSCSWMLFDWLCTPVAVPTTLNVSALVVPSALAPVTATL